MPASSASAARLELSPSSARKRRAILAAAEELFLRNGFLGTNMDEVAALSGVSKQTVYSHFGSKESLFVGLVSEMTTRAGDVVHAPDDKPAPDDDVARYLREYAERQLRVVLTPRLLQLRRLVIGEVSRFPDLARALYENGPQRAIAELERAFVNLAGRGLLKVDDARSAATNFNWLVMGAPVNEAMLLGNGAVPSAAEIQRHAAESARIYLAAFRAASPAGD